MVELCVPSLRDDEAMSRILTLLNRPNTEWVAQGHEDVEIVRSSEKARFRIPLSHRVTGSAIVEGVVALRFGRWISKLSLVPFARIQSSSVSQGPWHRALGLSVFSVESVEGPVSTRIVGLDTEVAHQWWDTVHALTVGAVNSTATTRRRKRTPV